MMINGIQSLEIHSNSWSAFNEVHECHIPIDKIGYVKITLNLISHDPGEEDHEEEGKPPHIFYEKPDQY